MLPPHPAARGASQRRRSPATAVTGCDGGANLYVRGAVQLVTTVIPDTD